MKKKLWSEFRKSLEGIADRYTAKAERIEQSDDIADGDSFLSGAEKAALAAKYYGKAEAVEMVDEFVDEARSESEEVKRSIVAPIVLSKVNDLIVAESAELESAKRKNLSTSAIVARLTAEVDQLGRLKKQVEGFVNRPVDKEN